MYWKRKHLRNGKHYYTTYHGYINNVLIDAKILPQDTEYTDHSYVGHTDSGPIFIGDTVRAFVENKPILGMIAYADNPFFCYVLHPLNAKQEPMNAFIELHKLENITKHE